MLITIIDNDFILMLVELAWCNGCVMDCHATTRGSIPGGDGVKTELHVLHKGQYMGVLFLNDLIVDGTLNTTNQHINGSKLSIKYIIVSLF